MNFKDLIYIRESCRVYKDQEVEKEKLEQIVQMARLAPSTCNSQPWTMHVVHSKDLVPLIAKAVQTGAMNRFANSAKAFIVIVEDKEKLIAQMAGTIKSLDYLPIDIGILSSYLALATSEVGLSSCILGWFNGNEIKKILKLPKSKKVQLVLSIGYSETIIPRPKKRKDLDAIYKYY